MLDFKIVWTLRLILLRSKCCPHNGRREREKKMYEHYSFGSSSSSVFVHSKISCSNPLGAMNAKCDVIFFFFLKEWDSCYLIFVFIVLPKKKKKMFVDGVVCFKFLELRNYLFPSNFWCWSIFFLFLFFGFLLPRCRCALFQLN